MLELKEGYKKTKFGFIPNDWEIKRLKDIGNSTIGLTYSPADVVDKGGTLVLRSSNIKDGKLTFMDNVYVKKDIPKKLFLKKGDILVCSRNGSKRLIGKNALITEDANYSFGAFMSVFRTKYNEYLYQLFQTRMYKKQIGANLGATINQITTKDINSFQFPFPKNEKEQKKIVSILSTWDKAIELKEMLVEQKKEQKKGLMQKLLTGKIRLPNFEGEWEEATLGEIGEFLKGKGISKSETVEKGINCIRYGEIYTSHHFYIKEFYSFITKEVALESTQIKTNDLLFAGSGETAEEIGKAVAYIRDDEGYAGGDIIILRPKMDVDSLFLSYMVNTGRVAKERAKLGQGHSVVHIYPSNLANLKVLLPSYEEQKQIAGLLKQFDKNIDLIEQEVNELKLQKKGLMQLLLTGKVRVKV